MMARKSDELPPIYSEINGVLYGHGQEEEANKVLKEMWSKHLAKKKAELKHKKGA